MQPSAGGTLRAPQDLVLLIKPEDEGNKMIDDLGYQVVDETTFQVKYQGYCKKCHHTYWKYEVVQKVAGGFEHRNCMLALADPTPRKLNPKMEWMFAGLNKAKLKKKAKRKLYQNGDL
jgi:hypothetical protein